MITERVLRKWREDSLKQREYLSTISDDDVVSKYERELHERILRMTQELLSIYF